jgi:hypothetical protein
MSRAQIIELLAQYDAMQATVRNSKYALWSVIIAAVAAVASAISAAFSAYAVWPSCRDDLDHCGLGSDLRSNILPRSPTISRQTRHEVIDPQVGFALLAPTMACCFTVVYRGHIVPYRAVFINVFKGASEKPHRALCAL